MSEFDDDDEKVVITNWPGAFAYTVKCICTVLIIGIIVGGLAYCKMHGLA